MTELAIIRHGETDWNAEKRMQGHRDTPLNQNGLRQAARVAERLAKERWDAVVSSDLARAAETSAIIANRAGISNRLFDRRLRERYLGELEGTTPEERVKRWGERWHELDHGAESADSLFGRAYRFLEEICELHGGKRIIVVTHGGWIKTLFTRLFPERELSPPANASLSLIGREEGRWRLILYNSTEHLNG